MTKLDPGTYAITVRDRSDFYNFRLSGPGVYRFTELEFVGEVTWTVTLGEGRYRFICDPYSSSMMGNFNVGNVPPPAAATTTAAAATKTAPKPAAATTTARLDPGRRAIIFVPRGGRLSAVQYMLTYHPSSTTGSSVGEPIPAP